MSVGRFSDVFRMLLGVATNRVKYYPLAPTDAVFRRYRFADA